MDDRQKKSQEDLRQQEHDPEKEGQEELEAWRKHRERQRRPLVLPSRSKGSPPNRY